MKEKNKIILKKFLTYISVALALFWVGILIYGIYVEEQVSIKLEESNNQLYFKDITVPMDKTAINEEKKKEELDKALKEMIKPDEHQSPPNSNIQSNNNQNSQSQVGSLPEVGPTEKINPNLDTQANLQKNNNDILNNQVQPEQIKVDQASPSPQTGSNSQPIINSSITNTNINDTTKNNSNSAKTALKDQNYPVSVDANSENQSQANNINENQSLNQSANQQSDQGQSNNSQGNNNQVNVILPKITIIVTNLGINKTITEKSLKLPTSITLGFLPYTFNLKPLFQQSIDSGYNVLIYLPFEPKNYPTNDPGPNGILFENTAEKNLNIVKAMIANFPGAKGIYGNVRETFTSKKDSFSPILEYLLGQNLIVLLGRGLGNDSDKYLNSTINVMDPDIIIDLIPNKDAIERSLTDLVNHAKKTGHAIGYVNTYPIAIDTLIDWISKHDNVDCKIVPISQISSGN